MMNEANIPWIVLALLVVLGLVVVGVAIMRKRRGEEVETDYRAFFLMGPPLFAAGIATGNPGIWALGVIYTAFGLSHREDWVIEDDPSESSPDVRRRQRAVLLLLSGIATLAILAYALLR